MSLSGMAGREEAEAADGVVIDAMAEADLDAVVALESAVSNPAWSRAMFASEMANRRISAFFVARPRTPPGTPGTPGTSDRTSLGAIAGYLGCWLIFEEVHLLNVVVHPDWRRRGVATRLVHAAFDRASAAGVSRAMLEVRDSNQTAQCFYAELGFYVVARRSNYYHGPKEDALIMACDLTASGVTDAAGHLQDR